MTLKIEIVDGEIDPDFTDFAKACIKDAVLKHFSIPIDPAAIADTLHFFANDPDHIFMVAKMDGKVVGTILGQIKLYPFTKERFAVEDYLNVLEEYRGRDVGKYLLKNFELWARQRGCRFVVFGVNQLATHDPDRGNRFLKHASYHHYETAYFKELG